MESYKKHYRKKSSLPLLLVGLSFLLILASLGVYIALKIELVLYGGLALGVILGIVGFFLLVGFHKEHAKVLEKPLKDLDKEISELSIGKTNQVTEFSSIPEIRKVQETWNQVLDDFSNRLYTYPFSGKSVLEKYSSEDGLVSSDDFPQAVLSAICASEQYRSMVISFCLAGGNKEENRRLLWKEVVSTIKPIFGTFMGEDKLLIYVENVCTYTVLKNQILSLYSTFHPTTYLDDGTAQIDSFYASCAIYPYSPKEKLVEDSLAHLDANKKLSFPTLDWELGNKAPSQEGGERLREATILIERISQVLNDVRDFHEFKGSMEKVLQLFGKFLHSDHVGIMLIDEEEKNFVPFYEYCDSEEKKGFANYEKISVDSLKDYFKMFSDTGFFYGISNENLPFSIRKMMDNLQIHRFFHFELQHYRKIVGLLYFGDVEEKEPYHLVDHQILICMSRVINAFISAYLSFERDARVRLTLDSLLKRDGKYVYGVNPNTYELTYFSNNLTSYYPNIAVGKKCYEIFSDEGKVCECCPLKKVGEQYAIRPKLGKNLQISTLNHFDGRTMEAIVVLENVLEVVKKVTLDEVDPVLHIYNQGRLLHDYETELDTKGIGYFALFEVADYEETISKFGENGEKEVLGELQKRIQSQGLEDVLYRYDEKTFALMLRQYTRKDALDIMEKLFAIIHKPIGEGKLETSVSFHASLIAYPGVMENPKQLIDEIEEAKKESREFGYNHLYVFGERGGRKLERSAYILDVIQNAIQKNKFEIYLQPVVRLSDEVPFAAEALLRLNDPARGFIPPSEFVPIASNNGKMFEVELRLIEQIGEIWKTHGLNIFRQIGMQQISINLSMDSLQNPAFVSRVTQLYNKYHFPKSFLAFEVNEGMVAEKYDLIAPKMKQLAEIGVSWKVDNYGTSVSSRKQLLSLPLDTIKVDRSCLLDIERNSRAVVSLSYMVEFAKAENKQIVAQGVENEEQLKIIRDLKFDMVQGYYYSKPLPVNDYIKYLHFGK